MSVTGGGAGFATGTGGDHRLGERLSVLDNRAFTKGCAQSGGELRTRGIALRRLFRESFLKDSFHLGRRRRHAGAGVLGSEERIANISPVIESPRNGFSPESISKAMTANENWSAVGATG